MPAARKPSPQPKSVHGVKDAPASAPTTPPPPSKPAVATPLDKLATTILALPPPAREELLGRLKPKSQFLPQKSPAGGLADTMSFDALLERMEELDKENWTPRPGRYYFSKIGSCFRKEYLRDRNMPCDCGKPVDTCPEHRFDPGKSQPGKATERQIQLIQEQVYAYGREGTVLKDIRMTEAIEVETDQGTETIWLVGKSDQVIVGDNLEILEFTEVKSPFYWPKEKSKFTSQYGKVAPLTLAGISDDPDQPNGLVNISQVMQLAAGVAILRKRGHLIRKVTLFYIDRSNYRNHLHIMVSPEEANFLYEFGVWWATEHHLNLQADEPPLGRFFMASWECRYCPFAQACADLNAAAGTKNAIHPAMVGINARLAAVNHKD